jgi:uncharacterized membrane protein YraQ (UPF0718 family)
MDRIRIGKNRGGVMARKRKGSGMLTSTIILGVLAAVLLFIGYYRGEAQHIQGVKAGLIMLVEILPLLLFAFIVAGMVQVLLPHEALARWVGAESGLRGILIGSVAGGLTPGGPFVSLPLAAGLLRSGAGAGTMVAYITAWSLWAVNRLPMEVGILGWRFTLIRLGCTFLFPIIGGLIAQLLFASTDLG